MLLAAVVDNTRTVLGLLEPAPSHAAAGPGEAPAHVVARWQVSTDERRTADEWAVLVRGLLEDRLDPAPGAGVPGLPGSAAVGGLSGVALACTVPEVQTTWRQMLPDAFGGVPHVIVEPGVRSGIPVLADNPREVGADRICNALAALRLRGGPAVVVDFKTATTIDVVNTAGQYVGGIILPGVALSAEALGRRGAQLRRVELVQPRSVIARNTVEALQSGLVHGSAAQVDGLVDRVIEELDVPTESVHVISTGYLAGVVAPVCEVFTEHIEDLTLLGLAAVFSRNC